MNAPISDLRRARLNTGGAVNFVLGETGIKPEAANVTG